MAVLTNQDAFQLPLFQEDELGRNQEVFISSDTDYVIRDIKPYKIEEKIYDWNTNERISFEKLKAFVRLTSNNDVHDLSIGNLYATDSDVSGYNSFEHI